MDGITGADDGSLVSKHTDYIIASIMASNKSMAIVSISPWLH